MNDDTRGSDTRLFLVPLAIACIAAAAMFLTGCGTSTISKDVSDAGAAKELVFPDVKREAFLKEGVFPNLDNLRNMAPGLSKDQIYDLLGRPHYAEGLSGVREWDYLLNFRNEKTGEITRCQYKVLFDKNMLARNFHWRPQACADQLKRPEPPVRVVMREPAPVVTMAPPPPPPPPPAPKRLRLAADAAFALDKSVLQAEGRASLDKLASEFRGRSIERINVIGHADRLGNEPHNRELSQARAQAVREHLVARQVPAQLISAESRGSREPLVQCTDKQPRQALVDCLAPNRRVDVEVWLTEPATR